MQTAVMPAALFPDVSPATRKVMQANKGKDTKPEMVVRRLVHGMGYRYRLHRKDLPGRPDLVFGPRRKVIFVHGCFWHAHGCRHSKGLPKTNVEFWSAKLERNRRRDDLALEELEAQGWSSLVIWECQIRNKDDIARDIEDFIEAY